MEATILQDMVRLCNDALAEKAGISSDPENFPTYLKVRMATLVMSHIALIVSHCSKTRVGLSPNLDALDIPEGCCGSSRISSMQKHFVDITAGL